MGTEYQHWIVPSNPAFIPEQGCAARVHEVLVRFGLAGAHRIFDVGDGRQSPASGQLPSGPVPTNALIAYGELAEGEAVVALVGDEEGEPYVQRRLVLLGREQHVMGGSEEITVEAEGDVTATDFREGLWASHWATESGRVTAAVRGQIELPASFTGVFRAAIVLDFGKSLPPFLLADALGDLPPEMLEELGEVPTGRHLADPTFIEQLEEALGTELVELGFAY